MRISDWSSDVCSSDLLATPGFAEVDVEIGHRYAFGVQEAFEQQPELQGIEIGDRERPGDHRARARAAPRPHRNIRSEEHTSELQSLMRTSYAVFCLQKQNTSKHTSLMHLTTTIYFSHHQKLTT